ncbi:MAG: hypothetical protein V1874_07570 [Spirochaetota bacterium]
MKKIFIIILLLMPPAFAAPELNNKTGKYEELFFKANQLYRDGKYENALNAYLEVLGSGYESGDLYYNMGNACYRLKMTGHAVLYYERARAFIPRDADLDFNLRYVKKQTVDAVDAPSDIISTILFWSGYMTRDELLVLFFIVNFLFWSALVLRLYFKKEWTYYLPVILLVLWFSSACTFGWKHFSEANDKRAVILAEETDVLSGPDSRETVLFKLHGGTIIIQENAEDEWKLIRLPDNKRGWIRDNTAETIKPK